MDKKSSIKYIKTGKCIWCGRTEPLASFRTKPHVIPEALGGQELGFDICDDCNHYFGTATKYKPNIDLVFKEIFGAYRFFCNNLNEQSYKDFSSIYFRYYHHKRIVRVKPNFRSSIITRQFKRGLYNVFLQKYHSFTSDGNNPAFCHVRDFARYDIGDLRVFYAFNNLILAPEDRSVPEVPMSTGLIDEMFQYGAFEFWCMGHTFYLEVFPTIFAVRGREYLQKHANQDLVIAEGNERIFELRNIMQADFFMMRFSSK